MSRVKNRSTGRLNANEGFAFATWIKEANLEWLNTSSAARIAQAAASQLGFPITESTVNTYRNGKPPIREGWIVARPTNNPYVKLVARIERIEQSLGMDPWTDEDVAEEHAAD